MCNWKKKIDNREKRLEKERLRIESEKNAQKRKTTQEQLAPAIKRLGEAYKCHVCLRPATRPASIPHSSMSGDYSTDTWYEDDWSQPGDLFKCTICGEWTCEEDLYKGICKKCAKKL